MMAFEVKSRRREVAQRLVERRKTPRCVFVCGGEAHARFSLELRTRTVSAVGCDRAALLFRGVGRHVEMLGARRRLLCGSRTRDQCGRCGAGSRSGGEQKSATIRRCAGRKHAVFAFALFLLGGLPRKMTGFGSDHIVDHALRSVIDCGGRRAQGLLLGLRAAAIRARALTVGTRPPVGKLFSLRANWLLSATIRRAIENYFL